MASSRPTDSNDDRIFASVRRCAQVSLPTAEIDEEHLARLCESGKAMLRSKVINMIVEAGQMPVLIHYSADGTPLSSKSRHRATLPSGKALIVTGRATDEFLVQHLFARYFDVSGTVKSSLLLCDPRPLTEGKGCLACFSIAKDFIVFPRDCGHAGICVVHCSFDRAMFEPMQQLVKKYVQHKALSYAETMGDDVSLDLLELCDWSVASACALHDAHNALKWSMYNHFQDKLMLSDVYIAIASCINAYNLVHKHLAPWLLEHLDYAPDDSLPCQRDLEQLLTALRLDPELVDVLASDLRIWWSEGKLLVAMSRRDDADLFAKVFNAMMGVLRFKTFSSSRWVTVGTSCRCLVSALLLGLDSLVDRVRADPKSSDYHIGGFQKLDARAREFVAMACLTSFLSEAFLLRLMEDNRLVRQIEELEAILDEEMQYLGTISDFVWSALGKVGGLRVQQIKSKTFLSAHVCVTFLQNKTLHEARQYPWSIAAGNQDENLDKLADLDVAPGEPVAAKIWTLLQGGFSRQKIKDGLRLLLECPWGTASAEQQHASGTLVKKHHAEIGMDTLCLRALVHTMRLILPSRSMEEKMLDREHRRLCALMSRNPAKVSGRNLFFRDLLDVAKDRGVSSTKPGEKVHELIMRRHSVHWTNMAPERRGQYMKQAEAERSGIRRKNTEDLNDAFDRIAALRQRTADNETECGPLRFSSCQLDSDDKDAWATMYDSTAFSHDRVKVLRERTLVAPPVIGADLQARLAEQRVWLRPLPTARPFWLGPMCRNRDEFENTALLLFVEEEWRAWKFMYATQSPLKAHFSELHAADWHLSTTTITNRTWSEGMQRGDCMKWTCDTIAKMDWSQLPVCDEERVFVLRHVYFDSPTTLSSVAEPVPLALYLSWLPTDAAASSTGETRPRAAPARPRGGLSDILDRHPALTSLLTARTKSNKPESDDGSTSSSDASPAEGDVAPELDEDSVAAVFAELEKMREEWKDPVVDVPNFKVVLLGGPSLKKKTGAEFDAWKGIARGDALENWCKVYGMQAGARFNVATYGEGGGHQFASEWCRKMQFFYDLHQASGDPFHVFSDEEVAGYEESPDFVVFAVALPAGQARTRLTWFRNLRPR